jgi:hypothetical protein
MENEVKKLGNVNERKWLTANGPSTTLTMSPTWMVFFCESIALMNREFRLLSMVWGLMRST